MNRWCSRTVLWDGRGGPVQRGRSVVVNDGPIAGILDAASPSPAGVHQIDASGKTLIPGLIDAHVHLIHTWRTPWSSHSRTISTETSGAVAITTSSSGLGRAPPCERRKPSDTNPTRAVRAIASSGGILPK